MNKFLLTTLICCSTLSILPAQDEAEAAVERAVQAIEQAMHLSKDANKPEEQELDAPQTSEQLDATLQIESSTEEDSKIALIDREAVALEPETLHQNLASLKEEELPEQPAQQNTEEPILTKLNAYTELVRPGRSVTTSEDNLTLHTPWKPKPLQKAPQGWRYIKGSPDQSYPTSVHLSNGKKIQLNITPYILSPEDSSETALVIEPGYQPELGYAQINSISATLHHSNQELEKTEEQLNSSIELLDQLLTSLPQ